MEEPEELHPAVRGLKTVCRCNNIKYRTIERAIRDGARSLTAIAVKTTATTGHCGGTCTPDIQQMLADLGARQPVLARSAGGEGQWWVKK
jgi:NAD(P)H-nitrite reductase large subunit